MDMDTTQVTNKPPQNPNYKRTPGLALNNYVKIQQNKSKRS